MPRCILLMRSVLLINLIFIVLYLHVIIDCNICIGTEFISYYS